MDDAERAAVAIDIARNLLTLFEETITEYVASMRTLEPLIGKTGLTDKIEFDAMTAGNRTRLALLELEEA